MSVAVEAQLHLLLLGLLAVLLFTVLIAELLLYIVNVDNSIFLRLKCTTANFCWRSYLRPS